MTTTDERVALHLARFNDAVASGDWAGFAATFHDDAVMSFVDVPTGPFRGRAAIAAAYAAQPPTDTMTIMAVREIAPDTAFANFAWSRGGTGHMTVRWADGLVLELTIEFT